MGFAKPVAGKKSRLVVVSNRGACTLRETPLGPEYVPSVSGLVSAIEPVLKLEGGTWIAWGGRHGREGEILGVALPLPEGQQNYVFREVLLTAGEEDLYYQGFANSCLWPLCHSLLERSFFEEEYWASFLRVNEKFAFASLKGAAPGDLIWVHDYHLALVPGIIRRNRLHARIALFWHIPFPPADIFAALPWAGEILAGMLGAEMIGFHCQSYARNFLQSAVEILGAEADFVSGTVLYAGRRTRVIEAPIGIDWRDFEELACRPDVVQRAQDIRTAAGGEHLVLGVDRLDYTKGIPQRLKAIARLLENRPEMRKKLTFIQVAVPSRAGNPAYQDIKRQIEESAGRINGLFSEDYHVPIRYVYRSLSKEELAAHYLAADLALVTPVRDGMNLVAKEYVAANTYNTGMLILSPFAGAAARMKEALLANPYSAMETAEQLYRGLKMPLSEKTRRMGALLKAVREEDTAWWWRRIKDSWEVVGNEPVAGLAGREPGTPGGPGFKPPEIAAND